MPQLMPFSWSMWVFFVVVATWLFKFSEDGFSGGAWTSIKYINKLENKLQWA